MRSWSRSITTAPLGLAVALGLAAVSSSQAQAPEQVPDQAPAPAAQNPSPMVEYTRAHERIADEPMPGTRFELTNVVSKAVRLYIPDRGREARSVRLVVHFHGSAFVPERASFEADRPSAIAIVHVGAGSGVYRRAFEEPSAFKMLIEAATDSLASVGIDVISGIVLTAFSAGYGAVRAILKNEIVKNDIADIAGVILLDGLHTDYVPEHLPIFEGGELDASGLEPFITFAEQAVNGSKFMLITHSEIFPGTFSSTTETTDYLVGRLGLSRLPVLQCGPVGMQQLSEIRSGHLLIQGFAGNTAPDHVDHFHGMPAFLKAFGK